MTSPTPDKHKITIEFEDQTPRWFMIASITWGVIAMLVGVIIAFQLNFWQVNGHIFEMITRFLNETLHLRFIPIFETDGIEHLTFGRLRPLHTNAAIFAFVGNMIFCGVYYSTQRLCNTRTFSDVLSKIHFYGWQLIIVGAVISLPAGLTQGKEYAELIWPIDLAVVVIWVIFAVNFFMTLKIRREKSLYVALWFYIATIITVAMLYIVNSLQIPTSLVHSYPVFGGVQDALVQWWYGHNAVAFFLTTPILGIMYYFLPKAANRPVYSYRLSIIHFWSLVFIYIWAGPHHLLNTSLPKWLQLLGMFFSLMLWAPSWGGMINGLLTLRGAWDKLRTDPVIKFYVVAITFYGMATFEGPLLSIPSVSSLAHYTDWIVGHVHAGTLGWNGFMAAGMFYWLAPKFWGRELWSKNLANFHFWIGLVGILLYVSSLWFAGIIQGLMLNETDVTGTRLVNEFGQTVDKIQSLMLLRAIGGTFYLIGFVLLVINIWKTAQSGSPVNETREVYEDQSLEKDRMAWGAVFRNDPITYLFWGLFFGILWFFLPPGASHMALLCALGFAYLGVKRFRADSASWASWYDDLSENFVPFTVLVIIAVAIGGIVQIVPVITVNRAANVEDRLQKLYTPLELEGRDLYVSEGCYNCHSQMIRMLVPDVLRYGDYSRLGESIYDHPFQWGSKRTGPDLAREGTLRGDDWHYLHLLAPRSISGGSRMPNYPWLFEKETNFSSLPGKIAVQQRIGVPYPIMTPAEIEQGAREQALEIATRLVEKKVRIPERKDGANPTTPVEARDYLAGRQAIALIAYLQKLGSFDVVVTDPKAPEKLPSGILPGIPDAQRVGKPGTDTQQPKD
ncbi:MAG: cytochrome-c oxidase, cbb3-type subunit I [Verrucomicrobiales bacterium]|nr:cytochrome-c oxidase, cbb3-type subunit I [Verrucomicrobiales bacterium]